MNTGLALLAVLLGPVAAPDLQTYLTDNAGFSAADVAKAEREVVTKKFVPDDQAREVAVIGVVRIGVPVTFFVERFRRLHDFFGREGTLQFGVFSDPPVIGDMRSYQIPKDDLEALRDCQAADCKFKVGSPGIEKLRGLDPETPDYRATVTEWIRQRVVGYVREYRDKGNESLVVYVDKGRPMALADGFDRLLGQARYLYRYSPGFHDYLTKFPTARPAGVDDLFFWAVDDFGYRPVTAVVHASIYSKPDQSGVDALIALKQIYANHYFDARFELMALVADGAGPDAPGLHLVFVDRMLFDGDLGTIKRRMLESGVHKQIGANLAAMRDHLEAEYTAAAGE